MRHLLLPILFSILFINCKKNNDPDMEMESTVIEGQTFNTTLLIDGYVNNGTIIRNCTFENIEGDGLQIRDVNNLCIENCTFKNISKNAIRFRNSGASDGVKIVNNNIFNIEENGILASENHINTIIRGNTISNVATNNTSSLLGAPHHGIYFQGFNVHITENEIHDIINPNGNCISIRTYGTISQNKLYHANDHGISYFSDHPSNSQELLIENNFIYDNGKRGIHLSSDGTLENHIKKAVIRFNTIVSSDNSPIGINDNLSDVTIDIIGNIAIRTDGGSTFVFTTLPYQNSANLTSSTDIGFVDFEKRDLHILSSSSATKGANGITNFPTIDFDGEHRTTDLDIGADEIP